MPNGFDNPYITPLGEFEYTFAPGFDQYLQEIGSPFGSEFFSQYLQGYAPEEGYQGFSYQGINPEIMSALSNVFGTNAQSDFLQQGASDMDDMLDFLNMYGDDSDVDYSGLGDYIQQTSGGAPLTNINNMYSADIFDPESLATTLSQLAGFTYDLDTGDPIRAGEVKALTPEMIEKTTSAYYSPYEEGERESLVEKLGGDVAKVGTGGFAGSGARTAGLSGAERLYRGGYEDLLGDIMKMRGSATGDVLDTIYGWQELMDA